MMNLMWEIEIDDLAYKIICISLSDKQTYIFLVLGFNMKILVA